MAKSIEKVKEQLQKLYAMMDENSGASPAEVESAMKIARKLMLEYKLSEGDFLQKEAKVITEYTGIQYTTNKDFWIFRLACTLAENYCCRATVGSRRNMWTGRTSKSKEVVIMGFEDDVALVKSLLKYAVDSAFVEFKQIESKMRKLGYSFADMTAAKNAWGNGYQRGISEALAEQTKQDESFAMVLVTPKEVNDQVENLSKIKLNTSKATAKARNFDAEAVRGYKKGKEFSTKDKLVG